MALNDIYTALQRSLTGDPPDQRIDLYTASITEPALRDLTGVLALFGIRGPYSLSRANLSQTVTDVVLTGDGTFGVPNAPAGHVSNIRARLLGTSPDGIVNRFVLSLAVSDSGWTFDKTFPVLPDSQEYNGQTTAYQNSFLIGLPLGKPAFSARSGAGESLRLEGELPPAGKLERYADLFAPWPLRLEGTVAMPAGPTDSPAMDLLAISPSLVFKVIVTTLREVGLQIVVSNDLDAEVWGRTAFSALNLTATLTLGIVDPIVGHLSTPLLGSADLWRLLVVFEPGVATLTAGLAQIVQLFGIPPSFLLVPQGFDDFTGFYVSEVEIAIHSLKSSSIVPKVEHISVTIGSTKEWRPPIPFVRVRDVGTRWVMGWTPVQGREEKYLTGCVYGTVVIGGDPEPLSSSRALVEQGPLPLALATGDAFRVDINALIPQFIVAGALRTDDRIPIGSAFRYFFGDPGPPTESDMAITAFAFQADPRSQTYDASATITTNWSIPLGVNVAINLVALSFRINVTQGAVTGGITGEFLLIGGAPPGQPEPRFNVGAEYTGSDSPDGWIFTGSLYPNTSVELVSLVSNFIGVTPPDSLPTLTVETLSARFATGSKAYAVSGLVVGRWNPTLFGTQLSMSASAAVDIAGVGKGASPEGSLVGRFAINKIAVSAGINLKVKEPTYMFKVEFGGIWLSATTAWRGEAAARHQVLTLQLGGVTLGAMLEYLINLASPTLGFQLEAPWNILNRIELSRFLLTIDPTENSVEFVYAANADLTFARVDNIGVRYRRTQGKPAVNLILTGRFLDKQYTDKNPLSWNVISDPPPAVPGQGKSLVDLRYLGVGQRIALKPPLPDTVRATLARMAEDMGRVKDPNENPLKQSKIRFAADSEWLIGLNVKLLEMLELGIVFNDPRIYGLSIALSGGQAGSLAGLSFEILYKKITDDVGMFRIELQIPQAFRQINLGSVSITLGIIVVEIYTNGNFLIDLGFPYNRDFTRSFTVQVFPFIGRGGIYFGLLNGSTSRRVPAISNGTFAPVLELGIGLALGVGKEIILGPLSGGIYVQVEVIFQGVLGWFRPNSSGVEPAMYYWCQGMAAISGKVYGQVDFKIIKISVTVEAFALASVTFEAYKAAIFRLAAGVRVEAKVKILFFSVSFSFKATLEVSFTVGSNQATPWILAGGKSAPTQARLRSNVLPAARRDPGVRVRLLRTDHLVRRARRFAPSGVSATSDGYALDWNADLPVFTNSPRHKEFTMLPAFSITQVPVGWDGNQPANPDPQYRVSFLLFAPNGISPDANDPTAAAARSVEWSSQATVTSELTADTLMEAFLRWSISAVTGSPGNDGAATVTSGQLQLLVDQMDWPETPDMGFAIQNLQTFFKTNLWMQLKGDPSGDPATRGGMAFPIPPFLSWTSPQGGSKNFALEDPVGPLYEWGARQYMARYFPLNQPAGPAPPDVPADYESFATFIFRDWCLMVAKAAVQAVQQAMTGWEVQVTGAMSLADVAALFPTVQVMYTVRAGDTVDSVAATLGVTASDLEYLNPDLALRLLAAEVGSSIPIALGVSAQAVAVDNAAVELIAAVPLALGPVDYQVQTTDTLAGIAAWFHLPNAAALFDNTLLGVDPQLLNSGAGFQAPQTTYTPPAGFTRILTAAVFYVRYFTRIGVPDTEWYAQTTFDLNAGTALKDWNYNQPIPPGLTLKVPPALNVSDPNLAVSYTTLPGDTLMRIGAALSLSQNYATGTEPNATWPAFRDKVTSAGQSVTLPASPVGILPGETVLEVSNRVIVFAGNIPGLLGWIGSAQILNALTVVTVPAVQATTGTDGATLAALAARFGLSVADLGGRIQTHPIFSSASGKPLVVAHLAVQYIDPLVEKFLGGPEPAQISGMCSRYLLAGLRLPAPEENPTGHKTATGPLASIYDLTGQQFPGPTPDAEKPDDIALSVTVTVNAGTDWIILLSSTTVAEGETWESLAARAPAAAALNRALADPARLRAGMILDTGTATSLDFAYTNQELEKDYPATGLAISPTRGPLPLPVASQTPRTFGLDHRVELQSPVPLPIPQSGPPPLTGNSSLWPFSDGLLGRAKAGVTTPYDIVRAAYNATGAIDPAETVQSATFATMLPFEVRRLEGRDHVYDLLGADTVARQLLLEVWRYVQQEPGPPFTKVFLLLAPAPNAGNPSGLGVLATDAAGTFLIKTNETTETAPGSLAATRNAGAAPPSQYYASFADVARFLMLLWEGSVVGGAGYYLGFSATDGKDLPASAFDDGGKTTLYLLVVAGAQQALAPAGRTLLPFNNCAVVAPGLDPSENALFVEAADDSELITVAAVPAGNIGFTLTLPKATELSPLINQLFSMTTYEIPALPGSPFLMPAPGFPVTSQAEDGQHLPLFKRQRNARWAIAGRATAAQPSSNEFWRFDQVFPVSRFGPLAAAPAVAGLPDPAGDPYRGIGAQNLPTAQIQLGFSDVFGNVTAPPPPTPGLPPGAVVSPAGYTDAILSLANWPAATSSFSLTRADGVAKLTATIAPQPGASVPGPRESPLAAIETAKRQAEKYSEAYFQLAQPGITAWIRTSLKQDGKGQPLPLQTEVAPLWGFAAASYASSRSASSVLPARGSGTLQQTSERYGVSYADIAEANALEPMLKLFGSQTVTVPAFVAFADGDIADGIVLTARPGWPKPGSGAALLALASNAQVLPLRVGAILRTPDISAAIPPVTPPDPTPPLDVVARERHTSAGLLADDSSVLTGILQDGFVFEMDGLTVTVAEQVSTFVAVMQAFAQIGVNATVATIAETNKDKPGMLAPDAVLVSRHYIVEGTETLVHNQSGVSLADLAEKNAPTPDLFDAGAMVYLGNFSPAPSTGGDRPETLREFADRFACPPALLLSSNPGLPLPSTTTLMIPGAVALPSGAADLWTPYSIALNDTLDNIVTRFAPPPGPGTPAVNLAAANEFMPGTMAAGKTVTVTVDGQQYSTTTIPGDSFQSVVDRLRQQSTAIQLPALVGAIESVPGYLATGGLLMCPPAKLRSDVPVTVAAAAADYGIGPIAFAQANAGVLGLVTAGVELFNAKRSVAVVTPGNGTFNSILSQFAAAGAEMSIPTLLAANPTTPFMNSGALAFLPPTLASLTVTLGAEAGPFAAPMTPLTVVLRIQRPSAVVDPAFITPDGNGPVELADAPVPAPVDPNAAPGESLTAFAAALRAAFPELWLSTGRVADSQADLWIVDFGKSGIERVSVAPGVPSGTGTLWPRFFALRPLYNDLVARANVPIRALDDKGNLAGVTLTDYQGVDVEVWAQRFLADMDLFLTAPYSTGTYLNPDARSALDTVLDAKATLSKAIPNGLAPVLALNDPNAAAGQVQAAKALEQQLAVSLSRVYNTAAIVQYDASVTSAWTKGAPLKPARLAGSATQLGAQGVVVSPPFTLTNAKTSLDKSNSFVSFLMRLPDPAYSRAVDINLDYGFLDLEFAITPVSGVGGYEASDWLAFVPHIARSNKPQAVKTLLGESSVPIPLRAYPPLPVLLAQIARPSLEEPTLEQAPLWTFGLKYSHQHAAQDEVIVSATFNIAPPASMAEAVADPTDVASELAKYIAVADQLWGLLAGFADPTQKVPAGTLSNAAHTFATLASNVATAWQGKVWPPPTSSRAIGEAASDAPLAQRTYSFRVRIEYRSIDGREYFDRLFLVSEQPEPGPGGKWPDTFWSPLDGPPVKLDPGDPEDGVLIYSFPVAVPIPADEWPRITLEWGGMNVSAFQNARASMSVRRNQKLLGEKGPDTTSGFLYQTPVITAPELVTPLNTWPQRFDITARGATVAAALQSAFDALFGTTLGLPLTVGTLYGYELVAPSADDPEGLVVYLPVSLYPNQQLSRTMANEIALALAAWQKANQPATDHAEWVFSLTLYSQLDAGGTRPMLALERLVYRF